MSTSRVIIFVLIMTTISSTILAGLFYATEATAKQNEAVFNKRATLGAVKKYLPKDPKEMTDEEVLAIFENDIEQTSLDMEGNVLTDIKAEKIDMAKERKKPEAERKLPLFKYSSGGKDYYIMAVRGNGLWDEIWGNISLESDLKTIAGASFDHKAETAGLGAEIKESAQFQDNFIGKVIYDNTGNYTPVAVAKGAAKPNTNAVDGISGATITGDGVGEMVARCIKYYEPYFKKLKADGKVGMK